MGKTKKKVVWQVGNVRHTPFRAASVAPRRHAACWGARDRTALTKPCGNERGATDRREERGSVTDGRNAATTERQPDSVRESEQTRYNSSKACVRALASVCERDTQPEIERRVLRMGIRVEWGGWCVIRLFWGVMFALLAHSALCLIQPSSSSCYRYSPRVRAPFPICSSVYFY